MKSSKKTEKHKKKPGRQSLLTPETLAKFMTALKAGNYRDAACAYAGVARPTFYGWLAKGDEDPDSEYGEFRAHVIAAELQAEASMVMIWRTQMSTDYRAIRDFLERRYPSRWARREIHTHEGAIDTTGDAGPKVTDFADNPDAVEKYNQFLVAVASAHGADPRRAGAAS